MGTIRKRARDGTHYPWSKVVPIVPDRKVWFGPAFQLGGGLDVGAFTNEFVH